MKIALVIGHNARARGAVRVAAPMEAEFEWCGRLAEMMRRLSPQIEVFERTPGPSEIARVYAQTDEWGADVTCELHFNSVADPRATGTETLYSSERGKAVAERVQAAMVQALGLRDRGLVHRPAGRGAASLISGRAPAVLVEPYFGSNIADCMVAEERMGALAAALVQALGGALVLPVAPDRIAALEARVAELERLVKGDGR